MFNAIAFFTLISIAYAAVYIEGPCPDVKPVDYFNLTAFADSIWYEVARYPNDIESKGNCPTAQFKNTNGVITFLLTDVANGKLKKVEGKINYAPNAGKSGVINYMAHGFEATEHNEVAPITIVDVVYDSYAISYECLFNKKSNKGHVYAWIQSRSKKLEGDAKVAVNNFIKGASFLDADKFYWDEMDDASCNVKA